MLATMGPKRERQRKKRLSPAEFMVKYGLDKVPQEEIQKVAAKLRGEPSMHSGLTLPLVLFRHHLRFCKVFCFVITRSMY